jgi:hypothetical protein
MQRSSARLMARDAPIFLVAVLSLGTTLSACDSARSPVRGDEQVPSEMSILIPLSKPAAANISTAEIVITAGGMEEIRQALTVTGTALTGVVTGIPAGADRKFTINGYDSSGDLTYTGSETATVTAGERVRVAIIVRATNGSSSTQVVLDIASPVAASYAYSQLEDYLEISGEIRNPSSLTASNVSVVFTARNSSGAVMDQGTKSIGSVPPGNLFFTYRFSRRVFSSSGSPASQVDYSITHSLGGPDTGDVTLSGS